MNKYRLLLVYITLLCLMMLGCVVHHPGPVCQKDGNSYGIVNGAFRSRWWNYYERGLSYIEGECYKNALLDIERAIEINSIEKRMARTYGMHFVDYFPHRELGIINYFIGNLDNAKKELELSISQEPSSKARFFLDKIRKTLLKTEPIHAPEIIPNLSEIVTKEDYVSISGIVKDSHYVSGISVDRRKLFLEESSELVRFYEPLELKEGIHRIEITATNLLGGSAKQIVSVKVDRSGPVISIVNTKIKNSISGYLDDSTGDMTLIINGVDVSIPKGKKVAFSFNLKQAESKKNTVNIQAADKLGNKTYAEFSYSNPLYAKEDHIVSDVESYSSLKPFLDIVINDIDENTSVYSDKIYLDGHVKCDSGVESVTINNESVSNRKAAIVFFNYPMKLQEGNNPITIRASDKVGNSSEKIFSILRKIPTEKTLGVRMGLRILPPEVLRGQGLENIFQYELTDNLIKLKRFNIFGKDENTIADEKKIQNPNNVGYISPVPHASLIGCIDRSRLGVEIAVRVIDNETSQIMAICDIYAEQSEQADKNLVRMLSDGLGNKLLREFPLIEGNISESNEEKLYLDFKSNIIKPNRRLIVFREKQTVDSEILGYARTNKTMENLTEAVMIQKIDSIQINDKVITQ